MNSDIVKTIKEKFGNVDSVTMRNRGSKLYMTVVLKSLKLDDGWFNLITIENTLKDYFPNIYITSGNCNRMTFRLNDDNKD